MGRVDKPFSSWAQKATPSRLAKLMKQNNKHDLALDVYASQKDPSIQLLMERFKTVCPVLSPWFVQGQQAPVQDSGEQCAAVAAHGSPKTSLENRKMMWHASFR